MIKIPEGFKQYTNDNLELQKQNLSKLSDTVLKAIVANVHPNFFLHYHAELELKQRKLKAKRKVIK